ncbi:endopeptidase La [Ruminococcus sp. CAG:330]|uniref:endopeptidase La n=1 Tax=Ruminococcus sp. CAG:330 TaxID=1262954 RepID=UPI00033540F4|nr:endopeptidase La [Ruminococcus sp. CAG:330]CDE11941.1 lon protease [Ruminococcus sp. CAG:330]
MSTEITNHPNPSPEVPQETNRLPVVAMRGVVVFPGMTIHFDLVRETFLHALRAGMGKDRRVILVAQKDAIVEDPKPEDFYTVGVIADLRQVMRTPSGVTRVLAEGKTRISVSDFQKEADDYWTAAYDTLEEIEISPEEKNEEEALGRCIKASFQRYAELLPQAPEEMAAAIFCEKDIKKLFEQIVFNLAYDYTEKQLLLEENSWLERLRKLYQLMTDELDILTLERQIQAETQESIDTSQRDYYLREQQRLIAEKLGDREDPEAEMETYLEQIQKLPLDEQNRKKLAKEAERLSGIPQGAQEAFVIRSYLDTVLSLPWNKSSKCKVNLEKAANVLNRDHYGLQKVKERILESFAVRALNPDAQGQILCFVGPPGVGKTSIGKSIAKALGRKYERISLGGVRDESDIRGHRKTYVGSMPGRMIGAMIHAGTSNPLILLDEVDKMGNDFHGDPSAAMLEVLDSEQNKTFTDHYIEVPFDLSHVLFLATANTLDTIPAPLLDRMEIVELGSYTREEKFHIAKEHLLKKQLKKNGLKGTQCRIPDEVLYALIDSYTREAGVRELERTIGTLCRKAAKKIVEGDCKKVTFSADTLPEYLGPQKFRPDLQSHEDAVGVVNGLAWTSVGGVLMPMEVLAMPGKGQVECTGSLGDVMRESAKIAVSYVRSVAARYDIPEDFYTKYDLHIHAPEGAVPKDGPSAGVTMTTALVSALSGRPVRGDVAMTGEITLHGKVLPIGGLREKTMAAYKAGMHTVLIPEENVPDLEEVDPVVREHVRFVPAKTLDTVLETALCPKGDTESTVISSTILPTPTACPV